MANLGIHGRRDQRYPIRIPATVIRGQTELDLLTEDVGLRGVFLRTDNPPPLRQLVRVRMTLPPEGRVVAIHGMAVHRVPPGTPGRPPGVGLQFYAIDRDAQGAWDEFLAFVQRSAVAAPVAAPDPVRRAHPRHRAEIALRLEAFDELYSLISRDVSKGGMFVETDLDLPVGAEVLLHVPHPTTTETFSLAAAVRRRERGPVPGLGVEFIDLDEGRRHAFIEFVRDRLEVLEDVEVELIDDDIEVVDDAVATPRGAAGAAQLRQH